MKTKTLTPDQAAEVCAETMYQRDYAAQALGITLEETRPGYARMQMVVRPDMVNGHDICHGGMIFSLADTAFAYACNARNQVTVASGARVDFLGPARYEDRLTAVATECARSGRTGVYDVNVTNQAGALIAVFRGNAYRIQGEVVPGLEIE